MNNMVEMVKYYIIHKNADDNVIEYLNNKIDNVSLKDLILIQIELLYTDPSDSLVSNLVDKSTNIINLKLSKINLKDLIDLLCFLNKKTHDLVDNIELLENRNKDIFDKIKNENLDNIIFKNETKNECASRLINKTQDNIFVINKQKSLIDSINIWLNNLNNSFKKKINIIELEELLKTYIDLLPSLDKDDYVNNYISSVGTSIDEKLLKNNLITLITDIVPNLNLIYKQNSKSKNELYKLLDYYIDIVDNKIKKDIKKLEYEERILMKNKLKFFINDFSNKSEILNNFDYEYKVMVISNYLKYL